MSRAWPVALLLVGAAGPFNIKGTESMDFSIAPVFGLAQ